MSSTKSFTRMVWEQQEAASSREKLHKREFTRELINVFELSEKRSNKALLLLPSSLGPTSSPPTQHPSGGVGRIRYVALRSTGATGSEVILEPQNMFLCKCCGGISSGRMTCQPCLEEKPITPFYYCNRCIHITETQLDGSLVHSLKCCRHQTDMSQRDPLRLSAASQSEEEEIPDAMDVSWKDLPLIKLPLPVIPPRRLRCNLVVPTASQIPITTPRTEPSRKRAASPAKEEAPLKKVKGLVPLLKGWNKDKESSSKLKLPGPSHKRVYQFLQSNGNVPQKRPFILASSRNPPNSRIVIDLVKMGILVCVSDDQDEPCKYKVTERFRIRWQDEPLSFVASLPVHDEAEMIVCKPSATPDIIKEDGKLFFLPCLMEVTGKVEGPLFTTHVIEEAFPGLETTRFIKQGYRIKYDKSSEEAKELAPMVGKNVTHKSLVVFPRELVIRKRTEQREKESL